ncbi:HIT-like protein [Meira miltonrushii]|uniref:HIT-like protein n=1 Tax=Meira miltonrushii TaxID=1280837 RepID=A0A316VHD9_9BASI|nr:HIT-like protein [Meira miltonrushii]PWN36940.1 HIT-like protein [Meira miltonrushii]
MSDSTSSNGTGPIRFHTFDVSKQIFLERKHTIGIVNLMPIAPLHVLLIPRKPHHRLGEIPKNELADLFDAVQDVSGIVQRLTNSPACTVAIQDGKESGQSVPHLHVHVIPRKDGDFTPNDIIYAHLEEFGLQLHKNMQNSTDGHKPERGLAPDPSQERKPRSAQEMSSEADWIRQHSK